jgi:hypothetical protein
VNKRTIATILIVVITLVLVISSHNLLPASIAEEPSEQKNKLLVILLLNPASWEKGGEYETTLRSAIAYKNYLRSNFEVACAPAFAALGLNQIESIMMPILRFFYPNDVFLFVFPDAMWSFQ